MDFQSKRCIFIGYRVGHWGYKCLDVSTGKVYVSRHVFYEFLFPYEPPQTVVPSIHETPVILSSNPQLSYACSSISTGSNFQTTAPLPQNMATPTEPQFDLDVSIATFIRDPTQNQHADERPPPSLVFVPPSQPQNTHPMTTRSKNNIHKPKLPSESHIRYLLSKALMATVTNNEPEPTCYSKAIKHPN
jgi:histone deacetylase 1/2